MKIIKIIRKSKACGFSLAETLVAILILLMVSGVVAAGIPAASNAYAKVVDSANAQVLLSTTVSALRNQFEFARDVKISGTGSSAVISYTSSETGTRSSVKNSDDKEGVILTEYLKPDGTGGSKSLIVSDKAATKSLYLTYGGVTYDGNVVTFTDLKVIRKGSPEKELASVSSIKLNILTAG